jgi:glycosyltransferase involved in cell wall biosynthesis
MQHKVMVVGPTISQHIQKWFSASVFTKQLAPLEVFTLHNGGIAFQTPVNITYFKLFGNRVDFILCIPFFLLKWYILRPHLTNFHFMSSYGLLSLLLPKKNLVLNTWGSDVNLAYKSKSRLKRWLVKRALMRFAWINTPAEHLKHKLVALGAQASKIDVYQYGINFDQMPDSVDPAHGNSTLRFVSNRNWQALYRIELVISGFAHYLQSNPNIDAQLYVFGGGDIDDNKKLERVLESLPVEVRKNIHLKGYMERTAMLQFIASCNFYISIPERDGSPLSVLEAMYLGLYPIVSDIDANREILCDENATYVDVADSFSLANALGAAVTKHKIGDWRNINRRQVVENFDLLKNSAQFQQKILNLCQNKELR